MLFWHFIISNGEIKHSPFSAVLRVPPRGVIFSAAR